MPEPDIRPVQVYCRQYRWTLQQDGAPSQKGECFIHQASDMWSPNSPGYVVCGALSCSSAANRKFTTVVAVDQLKQAIVEEWNKLSQRFIDRSIDEWAEWRRRLIRVVGWTH